MSTPRRKNFLILFLANAASAAMAVLLPLAGGYFTLRNCLVAWMYGLVSTNLAAIPALFLLPGVLARRQQKRAPLLPVVIGGIALFTMAGCLLAQSALAAAGLMARGAFWHAYLRTVEIASPVGLAFGLGVFFYASLRSQLFEARQKLHEKEVAEERTRKLALESRLRTLEARIHPHFLFNTLNSISSLIRSDPVRAEVMVGRLSSLLRSLLDHTIAPLIPLQEEMGIVADYVEIEKARAGAKLRVALEVPNELGDVKVPPLAVQTLVENAVKHGVTPQRNGGDILVTASEGDGVAYIRVADSGPGFHLTAILPGHGLDNLVGRLDALFGERAGIKVDRKDGYAFVEMFVPRS